MKQTVVFWHQWCFREILLIQIKPSRKFIRVFVMCRYVYLSLLRECDHGVAVNNKNMWLLEVMRLLALKNRPNTCTTQLEHDVITTLYGRWYDIKTLKRRPYNVVMTSCVDWEPYHHRLSSLSSFLILFSITKLNPSAIVKPL